MPIRIYRAPQIGTGTFTDPYRSLLNTFIDVSQGDWFDEIDNPSARQSICTVHARQSVHDAIYADRIPNPGRIVYLSPLCADDIEKRAQLTATWTSFNKPFRNNCLSVLANYGITDADIPAGATLKDVLRLALTRFFDHQRAASGGVVPQSWGTFRFAGEDF